MRLFTRLSLFALAPLLNGACRAVGLSVASEGFSVATRFLTERLTDQSLRVGNALKAAVDQAWRALELALAGDSARTLLDAADDKAFREEVRVFVTNARGVESDFVPACLGELRAARDLGVFDDDGEADLAAQLGDLTRFGDPAALLVAEWKLADELAADLTAWGFPTLAAFLLLRPIGDPAAVPLLAVAVRYFFRRAVETDAKLFQGLAFAQLERIGQAQEQGVNALAGQLARIEGRLVELHATLADANPTNGNVPVALPVIPADQTNGVVAVSADDLLAVAGSPFDGKLRVFDVKTGKELRRLAGHGDWVTCLAIAGDNRTVASGSRDTTVKVWDALTGRLLRSITMKGSVPVAVAFTPDGRVVVHSDDGREKLFRVS